MSFTVNATREHSIGLRNTFFIIHGQHFTYVFNQAQTIRQAIEVSMMTNLGDYC